MINLLSTNNLTKVFTLLVMVGCSLITSAQVQVDEKGFDISAASIYYPHYIKPGKFIKEVGISQILLPFDWLESAAQAPLLQFHGVFGATKQFSIDTRFSSLIVSNQISIGPHWQHEFDKFSINVGYDVAYAFGTLNEFGFASSLSNWNNYPNLSIGFKVKEIAFTLRSEVNFVTSFSTTQGDNTLTRESNFYNGYSIGLYMEQRLWKDHVLVIGLKNTVGKYHFMAWPAFATFNRFYSMPEFYLGIIL